MVQIPIITECTFRVTSKALWEAITQPVKMRRWFFESMHSFIPEKGFTTRFNVIHNNKSYIHTWRVKNVIAGKMISYEWKYDNYAGNSLVTFELSPINGGIQLKVTHAGTETFPQVNPDFSRESFSKGWDHLIRNRLHGYLHDNVMRIL